MDHQNTVSLHKKNGKDHLFRFYLSTLLRWLVLWNCDKKIAWQQPFPFLLSDSWCRICALLKWVKIGEIMFANQCRPTSDNINWYLNQNLSHINAIWKCNLQNGGHFVSSDHLLGSNLFSDQCGWDKWVIKWLETHSMAHSHDKHPLCEYRHLEFQNIVRIIKHGSWVSCGY